MRRLPCQPARPVSARPCQSPAVMTVSDEATSGGMTLVGDADGATVTVPRAWTLDESWQAPAARPSRQVSLSMLADVLGYAVARRAVWVGDLADEPVLLTDDLYEIVTLLHAERAAA